MSASEQTALVKRPAARDAARALERAARKDAGGKTAAALIAGAQPADATHPYLIEKGVGMGGLYVGVLGQTVTVHGEDGKAKEYSIAGRLLVPVRTIDGELRNVQTIAADGTKLCLGGAQKIGTFHLLGEMRPGEPVAIAEGYATAASVHRADGMTVAMALDISNLAPVAMALRQRDPDRPIYMAADNDHHLPLRDPPLPNAGEQEAEAAVGAKMLLPAEVSERAAVGKGTDWNDYVARYGRAAVEALLRAEMIETAVARLCQAQRAASRQSASA